MYIYIYICVYIYVYIHISVELNHRKVRLMKPTRFPVTPLEVGLKGQYCLLLVICIYMYRSIYVNVCIYFYIYMYISLKNIFLYEELPKENFLNPNTKTKLWCNVHNMSVGM